MEVLKTYKGLEQKPPTERVLTRSAGTHLDLDLETDRGEQAVGASGLNGHDSPSHDDVAVLAYRLWESRGCPQGSPDNDWFQAVRELHIDTEGL